MVFKKQISEKSLLCLRLYVACIIMEFKKFNSSFQSKLRSDIKTIQKSKYIYTFADKTNNVYKYRPEEYKKLLHDNITKDYKKAPSNTLDLINKEAQQIITNNRIKGKIPKLDDSSAFITIKDHKSTFPRITKCRLLNPSKSHL